MLERSLAERLLSLAQSSGFALAGFTDLEIEEKDREGLEAFVAEARYGEMDWFPRYQSLRLDPRHLLHPLPDGNATQARSALVLGMVYIDRDFEEALGHSRFKIARYAAGRDYHRVLKRQAGPLLDLLREHSIEARVCVDSVPLPEKVLARKAGLGWQGKHTNLINRELGSWFLLCVILLSSEVDPAVTGSPVDQRSHPVVDLCRDCRLCLDACPTGALEPYRMDARRCLSYITIESKEDRRAYPAQREDWIFGCDICQEVCPYNRSPRGHRARRPVDLFEPHPAVVELLSSVPDESTRDRIAGTSLRRISLEQMRLNCEMASRGRSS